MEKEIDHVQSVTKVHFSQAFLGYLGQVERADIDAGGDEAVAIIVRHVVPKTWCARVRVCMCARARVCVCMCACVRVCVRAVSAGVECRLYRVCCVAHYSCAVI